MKYKLACILLVFFPTTSALAEDIFLTTTKQSIYDRALDDLTIAIADHDYKLIKIQPVDEGLRHMGYQSSNYKILFFSNNEQVESTLAASPMASVILPLRIILYQQGNTVVASAPSLKMWKGIFGQALDQSIEKWEQDVLAILKEFARER